MIDLKPHLDEPEVVALLARAIYPDPERVARAVHAYRTRDDLILLGTRAGDRVDGCLGLELRADGTATIRHVATAEHARRTGVARHLIDEAVRDLDLRELDAETDHEAVGFYRSCGFEVTSLGERYPGVERFLCRRVIADVDEPSR